MLIDKATSLDDATSACSNVTICRMHGNYYALATCRESPEIVPACVVQNGTDRHLLAEPSQLMTDLYNYYTKIAESAMTIPLSNLLLFSCRLAMG